MATDLLVTLADENYLEQAKQLFSSVYWNAGWTGDYLLLAHRVPEEKLAWFKEKGILIYHCDALAEGIIGSANHPATVLSKFYLFKTYFKKWERVVFLDADIIVRASLLGLTSLDGFAAPNATSLNLRKQFRTTDSVSDHDLWEKLKCEYPLRGRAFNTGVFAFTTDCIQVDTFSRLIELFTTFGTLSEFGEEAVLNLLLYKKWRMLPIIYNSYPDFMRWTYLIAPEKLQAIIIHFVSSLKPWDPKSPFYEEWLYNYRKAERINLARRRPAKKPGVEKKRGHISCV